MIKDDEKEKRVLKADGRLHVPMIFMDACTVLDDGLTGSMHRPGYRLTTDATAEDRIQTARAESESDLCSRYKTAPPDPVLDTKAATLNDEWDSASMYDLYDARLREAYKGGRDV